MQMTLECVRRKESPDAKNQSAKINIASCKQGRQKFCKNLEQNQCLLTMKILRGVREPARLLATSHKYVKEANLNQ